MLGSKWMMCAAMAAAMGPVMRAQQSTLSKVTFQNAGGFQQSELEAVAGLHAGQKATLEQMQAAAQHLIDTGFFEDVNVDSKGTGSALNLIFILKPIPANQITEVQFDNFIWLTPEELKAVVHKVVPLFNGELPESGTSLTQIDAALQAALGEKGVSGAVVQHGALMPTSADPVHTLSFRVVRPMVLVGEVKLDGVDPTVARDVNGAIARVIGTPLAEVEGELSSFGRVLAPYRDAGYVKVRLTDVHATVVRTLPSGVLVSVSAHVDAGAQYRVQELAMADSPLISAAALASEAKLHAGDVASRKQLLATLEAVEAAYDKQGYAEAYVDQKAVFDEATHTVSYQLTMVPGQQYRVRTVNVTGLPPEARTQFDQGWLLKPGDLFDPAYVRAFLKKNTALRGLAGYVGTYKTETDPQARQVDLTIAFVRTSGQG